MNLLSILLVFGLFCSSCSLQPDTGDPGLNVLNALFDVGRSLHTSGRPDPAADFSPFLRQTLNWTVEFAKTVYSSEPKTWIILQNSSWMLSAIDALREEERIEEGLSYFHSAVDHINSKNLEIGQRFLAKEYDRKITYQIENLHSALAPLLQNDVRLTEDNLNFARARCNSTPTSPEAMMSVLLTHLVTNCTEMKSMEFLRIRTMENAAELLPGSSFGGRASDLRREQESSGCILRHVLSNNNFYVPTVENFVQLFRKDITQIIIHGGLCAPLINEGTDIDVYTESLIRTAETIVFSMESFINVSMNAAWPTAHAKVVHDTLAKNVCIYCDIDNNKPKNEIYELRNIGYGSYTYQVVTFKANTSIKTGEQYSLELHNEDDCHVERKIGYSLIICRRNETYPVNRWGEVSEELTDLVYQKNSTINSLLGPIADHISNSDYNDEVYKFVEIPAISKVLEDQFKCLLVLRERQIENHAESKPFHVYYSHNQQERIPVFSHSFKVCTKRLFFLPGVCDLIHLFFFV